MVKTFLWLFHINYIMIWLLEHLNCDVSHFILHDLACDCQREGVNESEISRDLIVRNIISAQIQVVINIRLDLIVQLYPSTHLFSHVTINYTYNLNIFDRFVSEKEFFYFLGVNVLPSSDDHIFLSSYYL